MKDPVIGTQPVQPTAIILIVRPSNPRRSMDISDMHGFRVEMEVFPERGDIAIIDVQMVGGASTEAQAAALLHSLREKFSPAQQH